MNKKTFYNNKSKIFSILKYTGIYGQVDKKVLLGKKKSIENFLILLKTYQLIQFKYLKKNFRDVEKKTIKNSILENQKFSEKSKHNHNTNLFLFNYIRYKKMFHVLAAHHVLSNILENIYKKKNDGGFVCSMNTRRTGNKNKMKIVQR